MQIRAETKDDKQSVRRVNEAAFARRAEADLVDTLRKQAQPIVSLVAEASGKIIGHILFSPVTLEGGPELNIMGLAPMAVLPDHQREGVGAALVRAGLDACQRLGCGAVVVLGHPEYYPRFGFVPSARYGIHSEYAVPADVFLVKELRDGYLRGASGVISYHAVFRDV